MRLSRPTLRQLLPCPTRAEALHGAARFCRRKGIYEHGYEFATRGLAIPYPVDAPSVEGWIYEFGLLDELAVNAYWIGRYRECADACDRLLSEGKLPIEKRDRVLKNKDYALAKQQEIAASSSPKSAFATKANASAQTAATSWVPERPAAGTELMVAGLRERLGEELERINLQVNHPGHDRTDKRPRVVWMHHNVDQRWVQWCKDRELVDSVELLRFRVILAKGTIPQCLRAAPATMLRAPTCLGPKRGSAALGSGIELALCLYKHAFSWAFCAS